MTATLVDNDFDQIPSFLMVNLHIELNSISEFKESSFDKFLRKEWNQKMRDGCFRYGLEKIRRKRLEGRFELEITLNTCRLTNRSSPQSVNDLDEPFDETKFSFLRINRRQIVCCFGNRNEYETNESFRNDQAANEEDQNWLEKCVGPPLPTVGDAEAKEFATAAKNDIEVVRNIVIDSSTSLNNYVGIGEHFLLINVSPKEFGHVLLIPFMHRKDNQVLRADSIEIALRCFALSEANNLILLFNSLLSFASVNHLHFHLYYLQHPIGLEKWPIETILSDADRPVLSLMRDWLAPGWVFQVTREEDIPVVAGRVFLASQVCCRERLAVNLVVIRRKMIAHCDGVGETEKSSLLVAPPFLDSTADCESSNSNYYRVESMKFPTLYLFPKLPILDNKLHSGLKMRPGVSEIAGHILIYDEEFFDIVTEDDVVKMFDCVRLNLVQFDKLTNVIVDRLKMTDD